MIDDPIVIRKSRKLLVVSSSKPTDPIQLVRELSHNQLEVHLKNGSKYIEELHEGDDIQEIILEMMGYGEMRVTFGFHSWPESQTGLLEFYEDEEDMKRIGEQFINMIFSPTPYMNSKFLSMELKDVSEKSDIKYYDDTYSNYNVEYTISFRARVDDVSAIEYAFQSDIVSMAHTLVKNKHRHYDRACVNDCWVNVQVIE
jgi:hypothetical protein